MRPILLRQSQQGFHDVFGALWQLNQGNGCAAHLRQVDQGGSNDRSFEFSHVGLRQRRRNGIWHSRGVWDLAECLCDHAPSGTTRTAKAPGFEDLPTERPSLLTNPRGAMPLGGLGGTNCGFCGLRRSKGFYGHRAFFAEDFPLSFFKISFSPCRGNGPDVFSKGSGIKCKRFTLDDAVRENGPVRLA